MPGVMDRILEAMGLRQAPPSNTPGGPLTDVDPRDALKEQGYELDGPDAVGDSRDSLKETGYQLHSDSSMEDSRAALRDTGYQVDQPPADTPPDADFAAKLQTEAPPKVAEEQSFAADEQPHDAMPAEQPQETFAAEQPQDSFPAEQPPDAVPTETYAGAQPESPPMEQPPAPDSNPIDEPPPLDNPVDTGDVQTDPVGETFKHLDDPMAPSDDEPSTLLDLQPTDVAAGDLHSGLAPDLDAPDPDLDHDAALPDHDADQHADVHL